jgi:hypothetical protein
VVRQVSGSGDAMTKTLTQRVVKMTSLEFRAVRKLIGGVEFVAEKKAGILPKEQRALTRLWVRMLKVMP